MIAPIYVAYLLSGVLAGFAVSNLSWSPSSAHEEPERAPMQWQPGEHRKMMSMCKALCEDKALSYDVMTGKCSCRAPRKDK